MHNGKQLRMSYCGYRLLSQLLTSTWLKKESQYKGILALVHTKHKMEIIKKYNSCYPSSLQQGFVINES